MSKTNEVEWTVSHHSAGGVFEVETYLGFLDSGYWFIQRFVQDGVPSEAGFTVENAPTLRGFGLVVSASFPTLAEAKSFAADYRYGPGVLERALRLSELWALRNSRDAALRDAQAAIAELSASLRAEGFTFREIGLALDVSPQSVQQSLSRVAERDQ
jgi:hypothetical protein